MTYSNSLPRILSIAIFFPLIIYSCSSDPDPDACDLLLPTSFETSTTLDRGCYLARQTPTLGAGMTLTLVPGTKIVFSVDAGLEFGEGQALVAVGTEAEPIILTGSQTVRGAWNGLLFDTAERADNALEYVIVEYAGSTDANADAAAITLVSDSRPVRVSITHTTVRQSEGWGLWLTASSEVPAFGDNTFVENTLGPASVASEVANVLDEGSVYTGNGVDEVQVRSNRVGAVTWRDIGVPYVLTASLNVDAVWTLSPGVQLQLPAAAFIAVAGDEAGLSALGTALKPIRLSGTQAVAGHWGALIFDSSLNSANALDYVTLEHGGSNGDDADGTVVVRSDSHGVRVTMTNGAIRHSGEFAAWLGVYSEVNADFETSNTFEDNARGVYREQ